MRIQERLRAPLALDSVPPAPVQDILRAAIEAADLLDEAERVVEGVRGALSWIEVPFVTPETDAQELRTRIDRELYT